MKFALNAATKVRPRLQDESNNCQVSFGGDRFIHAYVSHQFSGDTGAKLNVTARARQFSCFILLIGTITGPDLFDPKFATIVKDKDDLSIPILCETVRTSTLFPLLSLLSSLFFLFSLLSSLISSLFSSLFSLFSSFFPSLFPLLSMQSN
jgi:hypothetical protein